MNQPNKEDINSTWPYLEDGISRIMNNLKDGMDMPTYMGIYTAVHNFCTSLKGASQASTLTSATHRGGAHLLGDELYQNLIQFLKKHLAELREKSKQFQDESLLHFYIKEWNRYTTAAKYINHMFRYLNRHWVKREMDEGKKGIYDVYTLHLVRWKLDLFEATQKQVMDGVLRLVEKQRNGETIETQVVKSILDSFVSLGLDENDSSKSTLEVYRQFFEAPFIAATTEYYRAESKQFVAENSVVEYMKKAEARLKEEEERVRLYLHPEIFSHLMKACQDVLIQEHAELLQGEFQQLLDENRQSDLQRMYNLLSRITEGLEPLRRKFATHVRAAGLAAVERVAAEAGDNLEPKVYVDALLEVYSHYSHLVEVAFAGEAEFVRSLDNACREFVNRNKVCKAASTKSPELLAKYADTLLKKSTKSAEEVDLEAKLTNIMTIFKYIEDKDVFQKFYSRMLAKRLVNSTSATDDAETSMIGKLKDACGFEYTNKLQRMFQDMQLSKDLNDSYKSWLSDKREKEAMDFTVQVLGTSFWPLNPPSTPFNPPEIITSTYTKFQKFYDEKHNGRKLNWLWQLCKGELKTNYCKNSKTPYTFQVSTYQMAILLLFNDALSLTYDEIQAATNLNKEALDPSLAVFLKARVLNASDPKPAPGVTFTLNEEYKSKKIRVNLNLTVKTEQKQDVEDTHKTIEEDRKLLMQAVIVRIMKARQVLKHVVLVQETIAQIKSRFSPKVPDIKKCIDMLIEKEYLQRIDGEKLRYLA